MTVSHAVLFAATITLGLVGRLHAQRPGAADTAPRIRRSSAAPDAGASVLCWRARPKPACQAILLTNFGAYFDLPTQTTISSARLVADWGLMINLNRRDAVGASFFASVDQDAGFESGPGLRYRRWIGEHGALDIALGAGSLSGNNQSGSLVYGLVKYSPVHWAGVALRPELVRKPGDVSRLRLSAGAELGGVAGFLVPVVGAVVGLVAFLANPPHIP